MKITFINKMKKFEMRFRYNFIISNDFIMKMNLKFLLIIKRIINLIIDINKDEKVVISLLNVLNDRFIANFKLNAFKMITIFNEILFEIEMKLNKLLTFFLIIAYLF